MSSYVTTNMRTARRLRRALIAAHLVLGAAIAAAVFGRAYAAAALAVVAWLLAFAVVARLVTQLERLP